MESHLEPRILENLAVYAYRALGREDIRIPRAFSIIFWGVGGLFVFLIARWFSGSIDYALIPTAIYLLLPFSGIASRGFQPDPMMVMFFTMAIYSQVRYFTRPTLEGLLVVGVISSVAILIKPHCIFALYGAFFSMSLWKSGLMKTISRPPLYIFGIITVLLGCSYYVVTGSGIGKNDLSLTVWLNVRYWINPAYWGGWLMHIRQVFGYPLFFAGILGVTFLHRGLFKACLIGLWGGYLAFGLVFSYHISTHDYYQLPYVTLLALSAAPVIYFGFEYLKNRGVSRIALSGIFSVAVFLGVRSIVIQMMIVNYDRHGRWQKNEKKIASEIGELLNHSTKVTYLAISEGYPLRYYGEISGKAFNISNEVIEKNLKKKDLPNLDKFLNGEILSFKPEYFVVTEILEYKRKPNLSDYVESRYPILARKPDYIIYDLREVKQ